LPKLSPARAGGHCINKAPKPCIPFIERGEHPSVLLG